MNRCRRWQKRIPEAIYGELDAETRESMERHFAGCEGCAGLYHQMAEAVRKMEARPAPDRPPEYWDAYWDRLEARMAHDAAPARPRRAPAVRAWAYGTAGAILFLSLGIFIGRTFLRTRPELPPQAGTASTGTAPSGRPGLERGEGTAALAVRASRYLKRSRVLLLAVVNSDPKDEDPFKLNLPLQKKASEELLLEAAALRKGLGSSDPRLERLIADLEMILLQIANLTPDSDETDIEIIRAGVEGRDILFKINLNETVRPKQKAVAGLSPAWPGENRDPARIRTAAAA
jgi:hypothetical protein